MSLRCITRPGDHINNTSFCSKQSYASYQIPSFHYSTYRKVDLQAKPEPSCPLITLMTANKVFHMQAQRSLLVRNVPQTYWWWLDNIHAADIIVLHVN